MPLPSFDSDNHSDIEGENPIQKILLVDRPPKKLQLRWAKKARLLPEKITIKKLFLIIKLILKADEIFDNQRIDGDLPEITMPNTQTIFKELNDGKISEELRFFSRGE